MAFLYIKTYNEINIPLLIGGKINMVVGNHRNAQILISESAVQHNIRQERNV